MSTITPAMLEQRRDALKNANDIRSARAAEKKRIWALTRTEGRLAVADLIEDPPEWLLSERVGKLLCWPRSTGTRFAHRVLVDATKNGDIPLLETLRVGSLGRSRRLRIAKVIRRGAE